ncbi:MAG: arsenic resistance N-acetyltransferase ArsN2 [Gemmatimonadaceae bacterium]
MTKQSAAVESRSSWSIRTASEKDAEAVRMLLREEALPTAGVPDDLANFLVAKRDGQETLLGTVGLERYSDAALLRSAAVRASERGTGIGEALVKRLIESARADGVRTLVLLTTTAEDWFPRFGFARITLAEVPSALHASAEFQGACPDSAVVMRLEL